MAYNEALADRLRVAFGARDDVHEKKMFGGIAFMLRGNMCCGVVKDEIMARVGPDQYAEALARPGAREMDFNGRPMNGYVFVAEEGCAGEAGMRSWVEMCERFVLTLPPK